MLKSVALLPINSLEKEEGKVSIFVTLRALFLAGILATKLMRVS